MYLTEPRVDDGFIEQLMSIYESTSPFIKLRAVRTGDGSFIPVVRDFSTGISLHRGNVAFADPRQALREAEKLANDLIRDGLKRRRK